MTELKKIHHPAEIPGFASESEEAAFWSTYQLADDYPMQQAADPDLEGVLSSEKL